MNNLEQLTIRGFKSIKNAHLTLRNFNVLIGSNGAGKSNFLSAFKLLNDILNKSLQLSVQDSGGADRLLHFGSKVSDEISFRLTRATGRTSRPLFDDGEMRKEKCSYGISLIPTQQDSLQIAKEYGDVNSFPDNDPMPSIAFARGRLETGLYESSEPIGRMLINFLPRPEIFHFQDTGKFSKIKQNCPLNDNQFLRSDAGNLAAYLYYLQSVQVSFYEKIIKTIQLVAPFFKDFNLRPMPLNPDFIRLEWNHRGSSEYFDISQLSDGTIRFICLATLLLQPNPPSLIIIDEPELGLHPAAIELLIEMLRSASVKSQVIISTQSVEMVRQFSPEEIIVVDRKNDESVFTRKNSQELAMWLDEYNMGELWEMNVIGGRP